jgi:hypothetical protein
MSLNEYPTNWYPDRIPNDLLQPFSQWIVAHNMQPLLPVFQAFLNPSGVGDWETTPALWCVLAVPPAILHSINTAGGGFIVLGGGQGIYDGIAAFLGASNVKLNSVVTSARRPLVNLFGKTPINLDIQDLTTGAQSSFNCNKLIIAHPQTAANLAYFDDLDVIESLVFSQVKTRYYFNGVADVQSGSLIAPPTFTFSVRNVNTNRAFGQPTFPGLISLARNLAFGPASILGSSETPLTNAAFATLAQTQINRLAPGGYLNATVTFTSYHEYQPYPVTDAINHPFGFYTQLRAIQGYRNTYYIGCLASYAGTYLVWEQAYDLIKREFA